MKLKFYKTILILVAVIFTIATTAQPEPVSLLRPRSTLERSNIVFQEMNEAQVKDILARESFSFLGRGDHVNVWWNPDYYFVICVPRNDQTTNKITISQYEEAKLFLGDHAVDFVVLDNVQLRSERGIITIPRLIIRDRVLTIDEIKKLKQSPNFPKVSMEAVSTAINETVAYVVSVAPDRTDYALPEEYGIVARDFYERGVIHPVLYDLAWWDEDTTPPPMRLPQPTSEALVWDI